MLFFFYISSLPSALRTYLERRCRKKAGRDRKKASTAGCSGLELAACSHFGFLHSCRPSEAASKAGGQQIPKCHGPGLNSTLVPTASSDDVSLTGLDCCCMCDCENMTTSVRDEKIALVFETVFEEHASEGEVTT